ncbi:MAG: hypothetical protein P1V35_01905 [Planctomycetota bacterium]|nr:hypothetical protein [Planctomycetota bacterium]
MEPPLPDSDPKVIFQFAMEFNAYEHWVTFEEAARVGRERTRDSREAVLTELFMAARGSRHRGDLAFVESYGELYPRILKYHRS